jgi:hypothetical protein
MSVNFVADRFIAMDVRAHSAIEVFRWHATIGLCCVDDGTIYTNSRPRYIKVSTLHGYIYIVTCWVFDVTNNS